MLMDFMESSNDWKLRRADRGHSKCFQMNKTFLWGERKGSLFPWHSRWGSAHTMWSAVKPKTATLLKWLASSKLLLNSTLYLYTCKFVDLFDVCFMWLSEFLNLILIWFEYHKRIFSKCMLFSWLWDIIFRNMNWSLIFLYASDAKQSGASLHPKASSLSHVLEFQHYDI